jgi:hypothetical protein
MPPLLLPHTQISHFSLFSYFYEEQTSNVHCCTDQNSTYCTVQVSRLIEERYKSNKQRWRRHPPQRKRRTNFEIEADNRRREREEEERVKARRDHFFTPRSIGETQDIVSARAAGQDISHQAGGEVAPTPFKATVRAPSNTDARKKNDPKNHKLPTSEDPLPWKKSS